MPSNNDELNPNLKRAVVKIQKWIEKLDADAFLGQLLPNLGGSNLGTEDGKSASNILGDAIAPTPIAFRCLAGWGVHIIFKPKVDDDMEKKYSF